MRITQPFNAVATFTLKTLVNAGLRHAWLLEHLPRIGQVRLRIPGGKDLVIRSYGDDHSVNHVYWTGAYEPDTFEVFYRLASRSLLTIDVGAHVGLYALLAGHANPQGTVYAFEPSIEIARRLAENIELNRLSNVRVITSAVGNRDGVAEFFQEATSGVPSNSTLRKANFERSKTTLLTSTVPIVTLDRFAQENGLARIDLVKIDTEGGELEVLQGMAGILDKHRPAIICEVLEGIADGPALEEVLLPHGYKFYLLTDKGPQLSQGIRGHKQWWNYLFTTVAPEKLLRGSSRAVEEKAV